MFVSDLALIPMCRAHKGRSLLHQACCSGSVSQVQILIRKHMADVNARDDQNNTPLCVAALSGKTEVIQCFPYQTLACDISQCSVSRAELEYRLMSMCLHIKTDIRLWL